MDAMALSEVGAQVAWDSLPNQKPIVMLNVEADVSLGVFLPVDKGQIWWVESKKGAQ